MDNNKLLDVNDMYEKIVAGICNTITCKIRSMEQYFENNCKTMQ